MIFYYYNITCVDFYYIFLQTYIYIYTYTAPTIRNIYLKSIIYISHQHCETNNENFFYIRKIFSKN